MALSQEQKMQLAKQLAEKRAVMGDTGFQSYLGKLESAIPQRRQEMIQQQTALDTEVKPTSVLGGLARFTGTEGLGVGLGAGIGSSENILAKGLRKVFTGSSETTTKGLEGSLDAGLKIQNDLISRIKQNKQEGKDTSRLEMALEIQAAQNDEAARAIGAIGTGGMTNRDIVASAVKTFGTIAGAGQYGGPGAVTGKLSTVTAPKLTTANTAGRGFLQGSVQGLKTGATSGGIFGGLSGLATGIQEDKGVLGTAYEVAKQGAAGAVIGGGVGTLAGGVGGTFQARANRKNELTQLLASADTVDGALTKTTLTQADEAVSAFSPEGTKMPSRQTAGFKLENGNLVADKKAQALLRQGVDDKSVAIMQSFSPEDTEAAKRMVKIVKEVSDTGIATQRQQEVVGSTFMKRVKDVENINRTAGQQIDDVARTKLSGVKVNAGRATDDFFNQLERSGVDVDTLRLAQTNDDLARAFEGSDFEGLGTVQKTIKNVLKRVDGGLEGADMDGLALHRTKRFIDNQVTYGKNAEGLTGDAERLLKGLRANIDDVLDTQFPEYNTANTQYKDTVEALDEVRRLIGRDFLGSKDIANLRAGEVMNRLLGNASAKPLSAVQNLENTARKYGMNYNDSIIKQISFADLLDDIYQTTPTRGLKGSVAGGVEQASGFLDRMRQSGFISASIDTGAEAAKSAIGITPEKAQEAIELYLGLTTR